MTKILQSIHSLVWGAPTLIFILGIGIVLSLRSGFAQLRLLPRSVSHFFRALASPSGDSSMRAFCTALAATVGTGNIAGVAGAISIGGPGAVFWIWICGIFGMMIKYAEAVLAVRYRTRNSRGEVTGGPMHIIRQGMGDRFGWLGTVYCVFGIIAAFGVGAAAQVNAVTVSVQNALSAFEIRVPALSFKLGILLAALIALTLLGGAGRIGAAAERLVPAAALTYFLMCLGVLLVCRRQLPAAFAAILEGAFHPKAVTGGLVGSSFRCLQVGISRGVFTNEAGMGTAAIAHGASQAEHPAEQGLLGILEVFIDTILICTLTALVILCSGTYIPYGVDTGAELTAAAFSAVYGGWASVLLCIEICLFAFAAILGWGLYGGRCAQYLFGDGAWKPFALCQTAAVLAGAVLGTDAVWLLSEIFNGLMALPNLTALAYLTPEVLRLTKEYTRKPGSIAANGGNYADFHQCKPLRALSHEKVPPLCGGGKAAGKTHLSSQHRSA